MPSWPRTIAQGQLVAGKIYKVWFWFPQTGDWITEPPIVMVGRSVGVLGDFENTGATRQKMYLNIVIIEPNGTEHAWQSPEVFLDPGQRDNASNFLKTTKPGIYRGRLELYACT